VEKWFEEFTANYIREHPKDRLTELIENERRAKYIYDPPFDPKKVIVFENGREMTLDDRKRIVKEQQSKCLICGQISKHLVADHDHTSGIFRGMLCSRCNLGLGHFSDKITTLISAAKYLRKYRLYKHFQA